MRRVIFRVILFLCVCFLFVCGVGKIEARAITSGIDVYSLPESDKQDFIDNLRVELVHGDTAQWPILCFDVREDGTTALAIDGNIIYVYDTSGRFQYGYRFHADGDFGIAFQGDLLAIYFVRGNTIALIDANGNCVDVLKLIDANQHMMHINEFLSRTTKDSCGKTYMLERDIDVGRSYARLVAVGEHGERTVLYDVSPVHKWSQVLLIASIVGFCAFVIWGCIKKSMDSELGKTQVCR